MMAQTHDCEGELSQDSRGSWTAICPHLGLAAMGDDWPEAKANLRATIKSGLGVLDRQGVKVPADVLRGDATYEDYPDVQQEDEKR